jgi:hypothetical protein
MVDLVVIRNKVIAFRNRVIVPHSLSILRYELDNAGFGNFGTRSVYIVSFGLSSEHIHLAYFIVPI